MKLIIRIIILLTLIVGCTENNDQNSQQATIMEDSIIQVESFNQLDSIDKVTNSSIVKDTTCSTQILRQTYEKMDSLNSEDICNFLLTFDPMCNSNAEFSEWSNELLFEVANKYPERLLEQLDKDSGISIEYILNEFSTPIHDGIYLAKILDKINETPVHENNTSKSRVSNAIMKAIENEKPAANSAQPPYSG